MVGVGERGMSAQGFPRNLGDPVISVSKSVAGAPVNCLQARRTSVLHVLWERISGHNTVPGHEDKRVVREG